VIPVSSNNLFLPALPALPAPTSNNTSANLIDATLAFFRKMTDAAEIHMRGLSYWLQSAIFGQYLWIEGLPRKMRPNIYVVLSGKSGLKRGSTLIDYGMEIFEKVTGSTSDAFLESGTVEGFVDQTNAIQRDDFHGLYYEYGTTLKEMMSKDWQRGIIGLKSKLYYGESFKQVLSRRSDKDSIREIRRNVFYDELGVMQEPELYLNDHIVRQGFVRRLLLLQPSVEDYSLERHKPFIDPSREGTRSKDLSALIESYKKRLDQIREVNTIHVSLVPPVIKTINEIDRSDYSKALANYSDPTDITASSDMEKVVKLCVLEAIADLNNNYMSMNGMGFLLVSNEHFQRVEPFYKLYAQRFREVVQEICTPKYDKVYRSTKKIETRILSIINDGTHASGELQNRLGMTKKDLREHIGNLVEEGLLVVVTIEGGRGRPNIFFHTDKKKAQITVSGGRGAGRIAKLYDASNYKEFEKEW
jgi:DNA-binding MarR family transcriptional regulator